jgi:hypothetical protein
MSIGSEHLHTWLTTLGVRVVLRGRFADDDAPPAIGADCEDQRTLKAMKPSTPSTTNQNSDMETDGGV